MRQLEKIIQDLESGDLPLEKAMSKFEEGIQLTRFCSQKLDETERKIQVLLKDNQGDIASEPFTQNEEFEE